MGTILLTGAAGFIGSHLAERLVASDHRVIGVDNFDPFYDRAIKESNLAGLRRAPGFRLAEGDLNDAAFRARLAKELGRVDAIVHLAAKAGVRPSIAAPLDYVRANVDATAGVLDLARGLDAGAVVFGSSSSVYGNTDAVPFSEDAVGLDPISPYAATKLAAETLCGTWSRIYGLRCVSLRFFTVIGERQRPDLALHGFTRAIAGGRPVSVFGDGSMRRDFTYVDDIVAGVEASIDYARALPAGAHEIINLGGHATTSVLELIALIEQALGQQAVLEYREAPPGDVRITYANIDKAERLLGYRPTVPVAEGVRRFVAWYRDAMRGAA